MTETDEEVRKFSVTSSRPLHKVIVTRKGGALGNAVRFQHSTDEIVSLKPVKDPKFSLMRKLVDRPVQAASSTVSRNTQTLWERTVASSCQYAASDFLAERLDAEMADSLAQFLAQPETSNAMEVALQSNETLDVFRSEFLTKDDEDVTGVGARNQTALKEIRNFHDVTYTKNKLVQHIEWVPGEKKGILACCYVTAQNFSSRVDRSGQPSTSHLLVWNFQDSLSPQCVFTSPWEIVIFKFWPEDKNFVIGGLENGQLALWRISNNEMGTTGGDKRENAGTSSGQQQAGSSLAVPGNGTLDERTRSKKAPSKSGSNLSGATTGSGAAASGSSTGSSSAGGLVGPKILSLIDESHRTAVTDICFIPSWVDVEGSGHAVMVDQKSSENGKNRYILTTGGDGQLLLWDILPAVQYLLESGKGSSSSSMMFTSESAETGMSGFRWKPIKKIQLIRQENATILGCVGLIYGPEDEESARNKSVVDHHFLTTFFASTEEGEVLVGDWASRAPAGEERKPDYVKQLSSLKTRSHRPCLSFSRSPFYKNVLLGVTDWSVVLWKVGDTGLSQNPIFSTSASPSAYFSAAAWSPTRPGVVVVGRLDGALEFWDFSDQSTKPTLISSVSSASISSLSFMGSLGSEYLAVGDGQGHLHVIQLPPSLIKQQGKGELGFVSQFMNSEEARVVLFEKRLAELSVKRSEEAKEAMLAVQQQQGFSSGNASATGSGTTSARVAEIVLTAEEKGLDSEYQVLLQSSINATTVAGNTDKKIKK